MTLTEAQEELYDMAENYREVLTKREIAVLSEAWNALEAMKNIKQAERTEEVVEILREYLNEVEV